MKVRKVKKSKAPQKKTYIALVLDKSGSMTSCLYQAINGFNEQLKVIRENGIKGGKTFVTLVTFNQDVNVLQEAVHSDAVEDINTGTYHPDGWTAMRDGVLRAIESLEKNDDGGEQTAFLVVTISDGLENASSTPAPTLAAKVKRLQDTGRWTFAYVGANQDLTQVSDTTGISASNTYAYRADSTGYSIMNSAVATSAGNYFAGRSRGLTASANYFAGSGNDVDLDATQTAGGLKWAASNLSGQLTGKTDTKLQNGSVASATTNKDNSNV